MSEHPDYAVARATLDAFIAGAEQPNTVGSKPSLEEARDAAELLDDLAAVEAAEGRAHQVAVQDLPPIDVEELAAELGMDTQGWSTRSVSFLECESTTSPPLPVPTKRLW